MEKRYLLLILAICLSISLIGCSNDKGEEVGNEKETMTITDMLGREVEIPANPTKFVNVGVGSLRLYTYVGPLDKLVGVEENEKERSIGVPYSIINADTFKELPTIGQGGPRGEANPEQILTVNPDVIFNTYATDIDAADDLQKKTGIPVVVLSYGEVDVFNQDIYDSLLLIGEITGSEERAEEVVGLLEGYHDDLVNRTKDIEEEDKPAVYVGALGSKGPQGIESTRGDYTLLNVLNANNVVDETGNKGSVMIDKEQIMNWDPEYIFIDLAGYHIVEEDYKKNPKLYDTLSAVKEDKVHVQLPYQLLSTNLDTAIADAYYMGTVLYPDKFSDINPEEKADEIYQELLGKPFYDQMAEDYKGFGTIKLGE